MNFFSALVFVKKHKTTLLLKKIAQIPYFFRAPGTTTLAVAGYPEKVA